MINAVNMIEKLRQEGLTAVKTEKWLLYLTLSSERNVNMERIGSLSDLDSNYTRSYVERTLRLLPRCGGLTPKLVEIVEEVLMWAETAKGGLPHQRRNWCSRGINLFAHNVGSAQIYAEETREPDPIRKEIIRALIATHGLIGQYVRGEVPLRDNELLRGLVDRQWLTVEELTALLQALNYCVIAGVDEALWTSVAAQVSGVIGLVANGRFDCQYTLRERLGRLRRQSIENGENFDAGFDALFSDRQVYSAIEGLLENTELWYVEAALYDFSLTEFIKIFLLIAREVTPGSVKHVSFEHLMRGIYIQHDGKKQINLYKKRIIEKYLAELPKETILTGELASSPHVSYEFARDDTPGDTVFFTFRFSLAGEKLIEFCEEADKSGVLYERAVILLFDIFGLRRDAYDRFYNEENYLQTMNGTVNHKSVLLEYIHGNRIIDIGPGGGGLMDLIEERYPDKQVTGVDISQNVLDNLLRKKQRENRRWEVLYGDALHLEKTVEKGGMDTIIFCSILHELFSYVEYEGQKFNRATLAAALQSAYKLLAPGGRILIRDGIMTEPENQERIIRFLSREGLDFLKRYAADFRGRPIVYREVGQNEVIMPVNDAMEFLYTYTWGEESYVHEVNEQFGYFTPTAYRELVSSILGNSAHIIHFRHFLQEGYDIALSRKIEFFDGDRRPARLPDSTCILVIEKLN